MAKHKYIESPEKMWELFTDYREHIKSNPIRKQVFVGKDGHVEYEERERPLTTEGFENYVADKEIISDLGKYFANTDNAYEDYRTICARIKRTVRDEQITGGMTGIYNPSITQRLNNLAEKQDNRLVDADGNDKEFSVTLNIK